MKNIEIKISSRKDYSKPEIARIFLDNSISLVMMTPNPMNPMPRGGTESPANSPTPFQSPFGDKPFG